MKAYNKNGSLVLDYDGTHDDSGVCGQISFHNPEFLKTMELLFCKKPYESVRSIVIDGVGIKVFFNTNIDG